MKKIAHIITIYFLLFFSSSCNTDFLDKAPLDQYSEAAVWNDPALIQAFVNSIYFGIPHGFSNIMMASISDESMYNGDFGSSNVTKSLVTPSDYSIWNTYNRQEGMIWENEYKYIRAANIFMGRIQAAPVDDAAMRTRLTGEVHFLRAYLYFNLLSIYGGVPIVTEAYGLGENYEVKRNTFEECVKFISEELDKAASMLPAVYSDAALKGRATKGAALGLKARLLLYAASDLYHNQSKWATGYANPELVGYVGANRTALWESAKAACKAVMDLGVYSMYKPVPGTGESAADNYAEMFLTKENSEDIFVRFFLPKTDEEWDGYNPGLYNNPNGYHGWGSNTPLGQLVDSYEMKDGTKFSWANPEHAKDPYKNREPRFYASILYEGAPWRKRPSDVIASDPVGIIQVGFWERWNATTSQTDVIPGLDTRKGPIEDWNGTYTGYYLRKFVDPKIDAQYVKQDWPWRYMRYTEILLNYAEACIGLGQETEAKTYINMIRKRAGMPDITETGAALVERYRNERKIELAYEDHRYFDVRRWMIAGSTFGHAKGVDVRYPLNADRTTATKPVYKVIEVQERGWRDRHYLLPIKLDEMNRNKLLIQNPLYD
ncbi:RagB/SusD family nutrient uptake outer membrane protein [Dyadobacter sp. CY312]|uniref:RagB/SusD family nutrient uptake outer membrane protein n=1 Tax=Dyadobacter sp. CY312 TaxID=2907303 RepID=UPI001F39D612|nr:RagB/SusD family nutrient uptake outer membrane protein [Dyadobacter sp. CY312]MCE7038943.1 RagB/SusD family nutrient uptake outer membrane protein [Dyadobacter sp. CY312]